MTSYSVDFWAHQVSSFIDTIIQSPTHLTGNSLGGYIAAILAATNPHQVLTLTLLNATPVWRGLHNFPLLPWNSQLPAPPLPFKLSSYFFNSVRSIPTISNLLSQCYHSPAAYLSDSLPHKIRAVTTNKAG